jgi:hypothetical protein
VDGIFTPTHKGLKGTSDAKSKPSDTTDGRASVVEQWKQKDVVVATLGFNNSAAEVVFA